MKKGKILIQSSNTKKTEHWLTAWLSCPKERQRIFKGGRVSCYNDETGMNQWLCTQPIFLKALKFDEVKHNKKGDVKKVIPFVVEIIKIFTGFILLTSTVTSKTDKLEE